MTPPPSVGPDSDSGDPIFPPGRTEVFLATAAVAAGILLAVLHLDARLRYDESRTIAFYATQPFAVAASTYDDTNNHVLHTLLVWVAHQFGGWNRIALRMPAFLSFCLLLPALWWFVRREYGPTAALFATAFVSTSPFFVNLATNARGYTLIMLLFVVALLCGQALVRSPDRKALWAAWAGALALGFYTVPLMAFSAATAVAWMLVARWRRYGRTGLPSFAARTAAWSVAALAVAVALYLPVFLAGGLASARTVATTSSKFVGSAIELAAHPLVLWGDWQWALPGWAQAALLALVVAGATARGRSCGRRGTLLLATGAAWAPMALHPLLLQARMALWTLLTFLVIAGAGAALLLRSARPPLRSVALALVLGTLSWWTIQPELTEEDPERVAVLALPAAPLSVVAGSMEPGDYFADCSTAGLRRTVLDLRATHPVDQDVSWFDPAADSSTSTRGWPVHRVSMPQDQAAAANPAGGTRGRLFLLEALPNTYGRCARNAGAPPVGGALEARWPEHELVAAFANEGTTGGTSRVYLLNEWAPQP